MKKLLLYLILLNCLSSCALWHAWFTKPEGIYMGQQEELGVRLELKDDETFWYYWDSGNDTNGISRGHWEKKFNKIILNSPDSAEYKLQDPFVILRMELSDTVENPVCEVVGTNFFPLYQAAWIVKRGHKVKFSGLTDRDGRFTAEFRGGDSILLSSPSYNAAALLVEAGGINNIRVQMLQGQQGIHVPFEDVKLEIKKKRLEHLEGGEADYICPVYKRYFKLNKDFWPNPR